MGVVEKQGDGGSEREHGAAEEESKGGVGEPERGALFFGEIASLDGGGAEAEVTEKNQHEENGCGHGEQAVLRGSDEPGENDDSDGFAGDADDVREKAAAIAGGGANDDGVRRGLGGAHAADGADNARARAVRC